MTLSLLLWALPVSGTAFVTEPAVVPAAGAEPHDTHASPSVPYWRARERGWFWYQEPALPVQEQAPPPPAELAPDPVQMLQALTAEAERELARAVLSPSPENLQRYMEVNARTIAMAHKFAVGWQRLLWRRPELDSRLHTPASNVALQALNDARAAHRAAHLQDLAQQHGLWFFFRGDCPVCHRFAPVLHRFAARYGFKVLAISMDGGHLAEFPEARVDRRAAAKLSLQAVPALYLVAPGKAEIVPVGYGYMSAGELERRLVTLTAEATP